MSFFAVIKGMSAAVLLFGSVSILYGAYMAVQNIGDQTNWVTTNGTYTFSIEYYRHSARMIMVSAGFFSLLVAIAMVGVISENFGLSQLGSTIVTMAMTTILIFHAARQTCTGAAIGSIFAATLLQMYVHGLHAKVAFQNETRNESSRTTRNQANGKSTFAAYGTKVTEIIKNTTKKVYSLKDGQSTSDKKPVLMHDA